MVVAAVVAVREVVGVVVVSRLSVRPEPVFQTSGGSASACIPAPRREYFREIIL